MDQTPVEVECEIYDILPGGKDGTGQRLLARTTDRREVAIVSDTPLPNIGREELHRFRGTWTRSGDPMIPNELHLTGPQPQRGRLIALMGDGAKVKTFGAGAALNERPAIIAGGYCGNSISISQSSSDSTLELSSLGDTSCPVIKWGANLIKGLTGTGTVMIINPRAFTPSLFRYYPDSPHQVAHLDPNDKTYDALAHKVPRGWSGFINMVTADAVAYGSPNSSHPAEEERMLRPRGRRIVMPYNPYETWECLYSAMTGLHAGFHAPKPDQRLSPDQRDRLSAAHELAHAIERTAGLYTLADSPDADKAQKDLEHDTWTHGCECFADAFAMLAVSHHEGTDSAARIWADLRHAGGWKDDVAHMTGPACHATLAEIQTLKSTGELARLTPDRMVEIARKIAEQHAFSPQQVSELKQTRADLLAQADITFPRFASHNTMPAYEALRHAAQSGDIPGDLAPRMISDAVKAIERLSHRPELVADTPDLWPTLDAAHQADLAETEAAFDDCIDGIGYLAYRQRQRHEPLAVDEPATGSMPAHPYDDRIEQAMRTRARPIWSRVETLIAKRVTPFKDDQPSRTDRIPDPVTLIWHSKPTSDLAACYDMTMQQRLTALADAIDNAPSFQPQQLDIKTQRQFDLITRLAQSIRCDLSGWSSLSSASDDAKDTLTRYVTDRAGHKTPRHSPAQLHQLRAILPELQRAITDTKSTPRP
ncbi:MAG: hypothetical protein Alpg2KO_30850 [Alphaproteobacteria bacterium]